MQSNCAPAKKSPNLCAKMTRAAGGKRTNNMNWQRLDRLVLSQKPSDYIEAYDQVFQYFEKNRDKETFTVQLVRWLRMHLAIRESGQLMLRGLAPFEGVTARLGWHSKTALFCVNRTWRNVGVFIQRHMAKLSHIFKHFEYSVLRSAESWRRNVLLGSHELRQVTSMHRLQELMWPMIFD